VDDVDEAMQTKQLHVISAMADRSCKIIEVLHYGSQKQGADARR
jgi:hypothetical protein